MLENIPIIIAGTGIDVVEGDGTVTISALVAESTEDDVSLADPVGLQLIARRRDSLSGETSADGDYVALNSTDKGEIYVKHVDTLDVNILSGSSSGTEYTEGDVDASIAGNAVLMEVAGNALAPLQGTVADGLLVNLGANNDVTVAAVTAITNALPAGTNYLGKTRLTDGTTDAEVVPLAGYNAQAVAIVDASGNQISSFGGGTQYTEDDASAANPVGSAVNLVRQDTPTTLTTADGDNVAQRGTNYGAAYTQVVTSAGAFVDTFGGGTQYAEGTTAATITGTAAMMEVAANVVQPIQGTVVDGLLVNLGANNDVTVTGTLTAVTAITNALPAGTNLLGNVGIDQTTPGTTNKVSLGSDTITVGSHDVTNAGTFAVQPSGNVAHDAVDSGNPVKIGTKAVSTLSTLTAVASLDRADGISDLLGRQLVAHIPAAAQISKSVNYTATQTGAAIWTPAAGKKVVVTSVVVGTYGTTAARVILWFGASGDTTYTAGTDQPLAIASFAPDATAKPGMALSYSVPVYCLTADYILRITTDAAISIDVTVHGYEI